MKRRTRRKPQSVLDQLEADGVITSPFAKKLRSTLKLKKLPAAGEITHDYLQPVLADRLLGTSGSAPIVGTGRGFG